MGDSKRQKCDQLLKQCSSLDSRSIRVPPLPPANETGAELAAPEEMASLTYQQQEHLQPAESLFRKPPSRREASGIRIPAPTVLPEAEVRTFSNQAPAVISQQAWQQPRYRTSDPQRPPLYLGSDAAPLPAAYPPWSMLPPPKAFRFPAGFAPSSSNFPAQCPPNPWPASSCNFCGAWSQRPSHFPAAPNPFQVPPWFRVDSHPALNSPAPRPPYPFSWPRCNCWRPCSQPFNIADVTRPLTGEYEMQRIRDPLVWRRMLQPFKGRRDDKGGRTLQSVARAWLMKFSYAIVANQWKADDCFAALDNCFDEDARIWYYRLNKFTARAQLRHYPQLEGWELFLTHFVEHFVFPPRLTKIQRYWGLRQLPQETLLDYAKALCGETIELCFSVHNNPSFVVKFLRGMNERSRAKLLQHNDCGAALRHALSCPANGCALDIDLAGLCQLMGGHAHLSRSGGCMLDCIEAICLKVDSLSVRLDHKPSVDEEEYKRLRNLVRFLE